MICQACQQANLPGGVRCVYCSTHFPPAPEFDVDFPAAGDPSARGRAAEPPPPRGRGLIGLLLGLGLLAFKWKSLVGLLQLGKLLPTLGSMVVFLAAESAVFG